MTSHLFCFGLGYSARHLARRLKQDGWTIAGTARTEAGADRIRTSGDTSFVFDGLTPGCGVGTAVQAATHIVISAPPGAEGDPVLRHHAADIAASRATWIGYLSTIGVYGNHDGGWVDETTPATPESERSRRRLLAENQWREFAGTSGKRVEIFRLAGIYGPGSSAVETLRQGTARAIIKPGQVFNRIHVEDIARTLVAAFSQPPRHTIYNVTDNEPAPPQDVLIYAAHLMGLPPPPEVPFEAAQLSEMGRSFYAENKRVRNGRIISDLGVTLAYPTYREGIAALVAHEASRAR